MDGLLSRFYADQETESEVLAVYHPASVEVG